jgi:hypothetical protein
MFLRTRLSLLHRLTRRTQIVDDPKVLPQTVDPPEPERPEVHR